MAAVLTVSLFGPAFADATAPDSSSNINMSMAVKNEARSSATGDIWIGAISAVIGISGFALSSNAKSAMDKAQASAASYEAQAASFEGTPTNNQPGQMYYDAFLSGGEYTLWITYGYSSDYYAYLMYDQNYQADLANFNAANKNASDQHKLASDSAQEAGIWAGVGYIGIGVGAVLIVKGLMALSNATNADGKLAWAPLRIVATSYPDSRLAMAYDF